jgi:hypothetical protein
MAEDRKRRRLAFRLRTLLAVVTLLALWLGWNLYRLEQRKEIGKYLAQFAIISSGEPIKPWKSLPWSWRLLGAEPIRSIEYQMSRISREELEHVQDAFPEAEVINYRLYD